MLLEVKNLKKYFKIGHNAYLKAVDNVSCLLYTSDAADD